MVLPSTIFGGGLAARASFLASTQPQARADKSTYTQNTISAIETLQTWYNNTEGLWETTGWWNSANCLTVLADFTALDPDSASDLKLYDVIGDTFTAAQQNVLIAAKTMLNGLGMVLTQSTYTKTPARDLKGRGNSGFINNYYDDEGWWALALIRSYDVAAVPGYLDVAKNIFEDMKAGTDDTCGGGIWWSKDKTYKNAIANELYLAVAASLANRVPSNKQYYLDIATAQWEWFKGSSLINSQNLINDGLTINSDGSCTNNGQQEWSYNQGVVLGGLVELSTALGNDTSTLDPAGLLAEASTIASAAMGALSTDGILHDVCEPDNCGGDGNQFKGIFLRNLHYLQLASPQDAVRTFILANADAIWSDDRDTANNQLGVDWAGPVTAGGGPTAATQSSAIDALVAAVAVA